MKKVMMPGTSGAMCILVLCRSWSLKAWEIPRQIMERSLISGNGSERK